MYAVDFTQASIVFGIKGKTLTADEEALFRDANPAGYILFSRNLETPSQVKKLTERLRELTENNEVLIMIDQEGGRVQRLRPPHWREYPPMSVFGERAEENIDEAVACVYLNYRLISLDLRALGINVNCAPVLDLPVKGSHRIIGDRAFSNNPQTAAKLGHAACDGLLAGGVLPVIKHIPGHGRATADSHVELPRIDTPLHKLREKDFIPFKALCDMPAAMTAHIVYTEIDAGAPCSASSTVIKETIRTEIGFKGLLFSDDVCMRALKGPVNARVASVLGAGCDIALHCDGNYRDMVAIAKSCPQITRAAIKRLNTAKRLIRDSDKFDAQAAKDRISAFLGNY